MRIAIISDSHDNVANLEKLLSKLNERGINVLIHAGDVSAPGVLKKTLSPLFKGTIHLIFGNVGDRELLAEVAKGLQNVKYYGDGGVIEVDNKKIGFTHFKDKTEKLVQEQKLDLGIFGHTHQAETYSANGVTFLNPGTIGGLYNKPTYALYDTESGEVKIVEL